MYERDKDERLRGIDQATFVFAALTAQEFIVEVLLANLLASHSPAAADKAATEIVDRWDRAFGTLTSDPTAIELQQRTLAATRALIERLVDKARRRADSVRNGKEGPPDPV